MADHTTTPVRPVLFIDVDGPLNPYAASTRAAKRNGYRTRNIEGYRVRLRRAHGPELTALPYDLAWGTDWQHAANTHIAPVLGLPPLPVVAFPTDPGVSPSHRHHKTAYLSAWAHHRPFAWVDDEPTDTDRAWLTHHHPAPTLVLTIDPTTGLTHDHLATLTTWAHTLDHQE